MKSKLIAGLIATLFLVNMLIMVNSVSADTPGDVTGDEIVDVEDLTICALALWSELGDPDWNPIADLNSDGIIDIFDLVIIGINFG